MNEAGQKRKAFLFGFNFERTAGFFVPDPLAQDEILFRVPSATNAALHSSAQPSALASEQSSALASEQSSVLASEQPSALASEQLSALASEQSFAEISRPELFSWPLSLGAYKKRFSIVKRGLRYGNSFLTNLTISTPIETPLSLVEIFRRSSSPYALYLPGRFVCFSPETFVRIEGQTIVSCPMKGTIDAALPDAASRILSDPKERCEHDTIVDLIRNDLGRVAEKVEVARYRYIDTVEGHNGSVLQVSSQIAGRLPSGYQERLGDVILDLLPAGSVSGAPKEATLQLIREAERAPRGYYTGIFGYFDGEIVDSAVLIRYIEQRNGKLYYRSGGGITINSRCRSEYREALQKVYLPFR